MSKHLWIGVAGLLVAATPALAQGVGGRVGASVDPDQFYGGVHVQSGELADNLRFQPNLEIGVGDDRTLYAVNFEFTYRLPPNALRLPASMAAWHLYVGGGPALNIYHVTNDTHSEGGFNALIGLAHSNGLLRKPNWVRSRVRPSSSPSATRFTPDRGASACRRLD